MADTRFDEFKCADCGDTVIDLKAAPVHLCILCEFEREFDASEE